MARNVNVEHTLAGPVAEVLRVVGVWTELVQRLCLLRVAHRDQGSTIPADTLAEHPGAQRSRLGALGTATMWARSSKGTATWPTRARDAGHRGRERGGFVSTVEVQPPSPSPMSCSLTMTHTTPTHALFSTAHTRIGQASVIALGSL